MGEPATMIQIDYYAQDQKKNPDHPSPQAFKTPLDLLCTEHTDLCKKIVRSGEIAEEDQLSFARQYLEIITFLDHHLMRGNDIKKAFQTLIINGEKGRRRG